MNFTYENNSIIGVVYNPDKYGLINLKPTGWKEGSLICCIIFDKELYQTLVENTGCQVELYGRIGFNDGSEIPHAMFGESVEIQPLETETRPNHGTENRNSRD